MRKVSLISLGCPKNLVDSEDLLAALNKEGFSHTSDTLEADFVLVNTCGFIEEAKRESVDEILKLRGVKEGGAKLLVFGCLAKRYGDELLKEIPEIDALWGVGEHDKIAEYCKRTMTRRCGDTETRGNNDNIAASPHRCAPASGSPPGSYAYIKIAEGCSRGCTYCVIPAIRGPYRSAAPDEILKKAEGHVRSGVKELILVAQDSGSYGGELKGCNISSLLRDISSIRGDFRLRLMYLNPTTIDDELISVIASRKKICKYLDIPLQHCSRRVLRAMGRAGSGESYRKTIRKIREAIPDVTLRTTFMVGFPGESEEDFSALKDFVEEMKFERLGVFAYSKEEGTRAAAMKGQIPKTTKEKRRHEVMKAQAYISLEKNRALIGRKSRALIDETDGVTAVARLCSQAPEIDGVVFVEKSETRNPKSETLKSGEFIIVKITEAYDYDLRGEIAQ